MKRQEKSAVKKKTHSYEDTVVQYRTDVMLKLSYMLAEKLKDVTVATTRGGQQVDPKASGLRPSGVNRLSYFAAEAQPRAFSHFLEISAWLFH